MNSILSGAIGGVITSLALPFTSYLTIRSLNHARTKLRIEPKIKNKTYDILYLRVLNLSWGTLKNVIPYIVVRYSDEDIATDPNINCYSVNTSDKPLMLSWAKFTSDGNRPEIDINQHEEPDLNLFRFHRDMGGRPLLEIASEQGFSHRGAKSRVLLEVPNDLPFEILITAENMKPIRKSFILKLASAEIVEW